MIALVALSVAAAPGLVLPPYGADGPIAIQCSLNDVATTVLTKVNIVNQISVLTNFRKGSGTVLETYDPNGVMKGASFSSIVLTLNPETRDSYVFLLETSQESSGRSVLLVRPDRYSALERPKTEFFGILGISGAAKPTHIGPCEILGGRRATDLFKSIRSWKAKKK